MSDEVDIKDYLEYADRMESIVGSASSESECTHEKGYLSRQAVFSCLDCTPPSKDLLVGFCYACSESCHVGHNVETLYTKRYFRCDCGTVPQLLCKFSEKSEKNCDNSYNQNFKGLYCNCSRPYPDSERPEMDTVEMIQCSVCEDWFHASHVNTTVPDDYEEMICPACITAHKFLACYAMAPVANVNMETQDNRGVEAVASATNNDNHENSLKSPAVVTSDADSSLKREVSEDGNEQPSKKQKCSNCFLSGHCDEEVAKRAYFFTKNFRENLCQCQSCTDLYKSHNIEFIKDTADSLSSYEEAGAVQRAQEEQELENTLASLPHKAKCDVARAVGSLRSTITDLFKTISEEGSDAVNREKIKQAFRNLAAETNMNPNIFDKM